MPQMLNRSAVDSPYGNSTPRQQLGLWLLVAAGFTLLCFGWIARGTTVLPTPVARVTIPDVNPAAVAAPLPSGPGWRVSVVRGTPTCDGAAIADAGKLHVGEWLETDAGDEAA